MNFFLLWSSTMDLKELLLYNTVRHFKNKHRNWCSRTTAYLCSLIYSTRSSTLPKPGSYITHNATQPQTAPSGIEVCCANTGSLEPPAAKIRSSFLFKLVVFSPDKHWLSDSTQLPLETPKALHNCFHICSGTPQHLETHVTMETSHF